MTDMPDSTEEACSKQAVSIDWKLLLYLAIGAIALFAGLALGKCMR